MEATTPISHEEIRNCRKLALFVYIHNKNESLRFCKISLKIGCLMPSGFLLHSTKIKNETLHRLLVAQGFFFVSLNYYLSENIFLKWAYLFIIINIYIPSK